MDGCSGKGGNGRHLSYHMVPKSDKDAAMVNSKHAREMGENGIV